MPKMIYCTTSDLIEAKKIAKILLEEKLVACVNIIPSVESMYTWNCSIENDTEAAMIIKTVDEKISVSINRIKELHSYDVPEILVLPIDHGLKEYLDFLRKETV